MGIEETHNHNKAEQKTEHSVKATDPNFQTYKDRPVFFFFYNNRTLVRYKNNFPAARIKPILSGDNILCYV